MLLSCGATMAASEDGERFKQIYEKEWAFRLNEFPMLAGRTGATDALSAAPCTPSAHQTMSLSLHVSVDPRPRPSGTHPGGTAGPKSAA